MVSAAAAGSTRKSFSAFSRMDGLFSGENSKYISKEFCTLKTGVDQGSLVLSLSCGEMYGGMRSGLCRILCQSIQSDNVIL